MTKIQNESLIARGGGGTAGADELLVDAADSTPDFLDAKIAEGQNVATTILNPGADEDLEIAATNLRDILVLDTTANAAITNEDVVKLTSGLGILIAFLPPLEDARKIITIVARGSAAGVLVVPNGTDIIEGLDVVPTGESLSYFPFAGEWNVV